MKSAKSFVLALSLTFLGLISCPGLSSIPGIQSLAYAEEPKISKEAVDILSKTSQAMAEIAAAVKPAVVNISSTRTIKTQGAQSPFFSDPFFRRFFGDEFGNANRPSERKQASLGSGVIVDRDGYVLTNNHVIKDADEIRVRLSDKREFKGKVMGADPKTDLAVVKIDSDHLPTIRWGDSDRLKAGEMVIAIGNPFGLSQTVTSGIVSATGRANVGIADYEDFIQTDAPINPGNSGGALVNVRGELVGINTAIFSTSGGYQGIGFAIPTSMAKVVMDSLVNKGKVIRGWLGVSVQPVTPDLAQQFGLKEEKGVLVGDVTENSPAEKSGLQRGDVIVEYEGKEVNDPSSLRNLVASTTPDKEIVMKLLRDGKPKTLKVIIAELPAEKQQLSGEFDTPLKGVHVQDITPDVRRNLAIPKRVTGVVITAIEEGSGAGPFLEKQDVIMEVNRKKILNAKEYESAVSRIKSSQNILVLVYRKGATIYVTLPAS
ncbi:MAG TPA: DegQ family serine endoprotease [Thermodesulfovibrionales bacterium]|nr:DegQ family serine endoprotease [Thermodesulfovibrionales bacterium]